MAKLDGTLLSVKFRFFREKTASLLPALFKFGQDEAKQQRGGRTLFLQVASSSHQKLTFKTGSYLQEKRSIFPPSIAPNKLGGKKKVSMAFIHGRC